MKLIDLSKIDNSDVKIAASSEQFQRLITLLNERQLPQHSVEKINHEIAELNASPLVGKPFLRVLKIKQSKITKEIEKEMKLVPKNYYKNLWMILGMSIFGLPLGFSFGLSIGNLGLVGLGLPIGMAIGLAVGTSLDKKALESGRQLDIELK